MKNLNWGDNAQEGWEIVGRIFHLQGLSPLKAQKRSYAERLLASSSSSFVKNFLTCKAQNRSSRENTEEPLLFPSLSWFSLNQRELVTCKKSSSVKFNATHMAPLVENQTTVREVVDQNSSWINTQGLKITEERVLP